MKKTIFVSFAIFLLAAVGFGQSSTVKPKDFQILTGGQWVGNLTYLDYGTGKQVSIPSILNVSASEKDKSSFVFDYQYPDEPKANGKNSVALSRDGKMVGDEMVIEKTKTVDQPLKIVTEKSGSDSDKKALFRFTYTLSKTEFSIKKEVKYEGTDNFFVRNEYRWKR